MKRINWKSVVVMAALLSFVALAGLGNSMLAPASVGAAPPAAPTPVTGLVYSPDRNYFDVYDTVTIAADTHSKILDISAQEWCDIEYVVNQDIDSAGVNTTTVTIEYSNDRTNWIDGPALVTSNAADASDMTRIPIFGRYMQFEMDVTNTATPTWTINAFCK
jgi:hypothetical protein